MPISKRVVSISKRVVPISERADPITNEPINPASIYSINYEREQYILKKDFKDL